MQINTKTVVEIESREFERFLREVKRLLYDDELTDVNAIRDFVDDTLSAIEQHEKKLARG